MLVVLILLLHNLSAQSNVNYYIKEWVIDKANMSIAVDEMIGGYNILDEQFYIYGGWKNINMANFNEYTFNPNTDIFESNTSLQPYFVDGQAQTTFISSTGSSFIYYSDQGYEGLNQQQNFYMFDMSKNAIFSLGESYPKPQPFLTECYANDGIQYVYIMGGFQFGYINGENSFWKFDVIQYKWIIGPSLNIPRRQASCMYVENKLFIFGGDHLNATWTTHKIETIDLSSSTNNNWQLLPPLNSTKFNNYPWKFVAFYPYSNGVNKDNWKSNTIFIYSANICVKFNFRTYDSMECNNIPNIVTWRSFKNGFAYIDNQYRYYVFGGSNSQSYDGEITNVIQYALLDYYNDTTYHQ